ncbi:MAG: methyltransferase domain-containing protein, partial [Candidatus Jordarchaeaceae archaeon]
NFGYNSCKQSLEIVAIDINPYAVRCAKENAKLNGVADKMFFIQGDLLTPIRAGEKFDLVLFNAPYLPSELSEGEIWIEKAWAGGVNGRAIVDSFLQDIPAYVKEGGRILLMQSTLSDVDKTIKILMTKGFKTRIVAKRDLPFFETIMLIEAKH